MTSKSVKSKKIASTPITAIARHFKFSLHPIIQDHLSMLLDCAPPPSWFFKDFELLQAAILEKSICVSHKPKTSTSGRAVVPYFGGFSVARILDFIPENFRARLQISLTIYPNISDERIRAIAVADAMSQVIFSPNATTPIKALFLNRDAPSKPQLIIPNGYGAPSETE